MEGSFFGWLAFTLFALKTIGMLSDALTGAEKKAESRVAAALVALANCLGAQWVWQVLHK